MASLGRAAGRASWRAHVACACLDDFSEIGMAQKEGSRGAVSVCVAKPGRAVPICCTFISFAYFFHASSRLKLMRQRPSP